MDIISIITALTMVLRSGLILLPPLYRMLLPDLALYVSCICCVVGMLGKQASGMRLLYFFSKGY